jgi:MoaA/NifB/PqqE/SkfB family radical SAM enzyme
MMWPAAILSRSADKFTVDPEYITAPAPKILWIELTSKCPFDCVFCTRKVRFGTGRNLDFEIYKRVIAELESPDYICLNYSGESIYYPRLLEAIRLAKSTGASIELVTAFSTISPALLRGIVESGLDRLAVSLHAMDPGKYQQIYQFGSVDLLKQRVNDLLEMKAALGVRTPRLNFCFVAMSENLDQLPLVADYAESVGVPEIFIHPIIGRHLVPHDFSNELSANKLREGFKDRIRNTIASVRSAHPDLPLQVLNPDLDANPHLSHTPGYFAPRLPAHGRIHSCDQPPFESVHILASGNVVVCEVHDEVSMGNLQEQSLRDIWLGPKYRDFRRKYVTDAAPECRDCVWKIAYVPDRWRSAIVVAEGMNPQLLRGWHAHEGTGIIWSKKQALLALANRHRGTRLRVTGVLPQGPDGQANSIAVTCNGAPVGEIQNQSSGFSQFDTSLSLPASAEYFYLNFATRHLFRPALHGPSIDARDLGFGLLRIEVCR